MDKDKVFRGVDAGLPRAIREDFPTWFAQTTAQAVLTLPSDVVIEGEPYTRADLALDLLHAEWGDGWTSVSPVEAAVRVVGWLRERSNPGHTRGLRLSRTGAPLLVRWGWESRGGDAEVLKETPAPVLPRQEHVLSALGWEKPHTFVSDALAWTQYNARTLLLRLCFVNGQVRDYGGIPHEVAAGLVGHWSPGGYYNQHIRDQYPSKLIKAAPPTRP